MNIQLALDRMTVEEAIRMAKQVRDSVEWIEVGTSLIKEYGVESIRAMKQAFPDKTIVADCKTIDNAKYEFEICFQAGADVATVMGVAPLVTIETCLEVAKKWNKRVMIDLLNTNASQLKELSSLKEAIFCQHVSKDQQELAGGSSDELHASFDASYEVAVAGGITLESIEKLTEMRPTVVIVGSAITKAENPNHAAAQFKQEIERVEE